MIDRWDEYFIEMAKVAARKSKDGTKVGCVLADRHHRTISVAYNGLPKGIRDSSDRLLNREIKLKITLHAEHNAVLFARCDLTGATAYVWPLPPCAHCSALLIQAGIERIVAPKPETELASRWKESLELGSVILREAGITLDLLPLESDHAVR